MTIARHIVIVGSSTDKNWASETGVAVTAREYVLQADKFADGKARVVNLSGDYRYMDLGYYASLLAEARGQKVIPAVSALLDLSRKTLYGVALSDVDDALRTVIGKMTHPPIAGFTLTVAFGQTRDPRFRDFARALFDDFRIPLLRVQISAEGGWRVKQLTILAPGELSPEDFDFFLTTLSAYTRAGWRAPRVKAMPRYSLAVLHNPRESLAPSSPDTLKKFVSVGAAMGLEVELIERKDFLRLAEYDALFIRETTTLENHTYRFARKAVYEGIPVIDDPTSILRCTNKVYLAELLQANKLPTPKTLIVDREGLLQVEERLGYPVVLKIPDGSFSRGVFKAGDRKELTDVSRKLFEKSDVILAQEYMYTEYDWRVGIMNRQPLFVSQYFMSRRHWQIIRHKETGKSEAGNWQTLATDKAPKAVVQAALKAANLIGDGLYGVDLKETDRGVFIIEINDNPNLDRGVEDAVLKDDLYRIVLSDFVRRIEER